MTFECHNNVTFISFDGIYDVCMNYNSDVLSIDIRHWKQKYELPRLVCIWSEVVICDKNSYYYVMNPINLNMYC